MAAIALVHVSKTYPNGHAAARDLTLDIHDGELLVLVGPSGSGKSTILRLIAGLETPSSGRIFIGARDVTGEPPQQRDLAMVFQSYALYPHKTVRQNLAFPLRMHGVPRADIEARVQRVAASLGLETMLDRKPAQLSGGQRQRVALARALAIDPTVLLLDEPFGALDAKVRVELRRWLRRLHEQTGQTTLFVTHDQEEALELADRVVVLREGRIEQVGTPDEIYSAPASEYVFDFIGRANALEGRVEAGRFVAHHQSQAFATDARNGAARLYVRPHDLAIVAADAGWPARVATALRLADRITLELAVEGQARPVELDFAAKPDVETPGVGSRIAIAPLRYQVYSR